MTIIEFIEDNLDDGFLIDDVISDIDCAMRGDWQCEENQLLCEECEDQCWSDNGEDDYHHYVCCNGRHPIYLDCGDCYHCELYNIVLDMSNEDKEEFKTYKCFM